jgi:hypothetical protein
MTTMNTLSRAITAQIRGDSTSYNALRHHWRDLMSSPRKHELTAVHQLLYLALVGRDWRRGFTCVTNQRKLDNGAFYGWVLFRALAALHTPSREQELLVPFDGLVTPAMLERLRPLIPIQNVYAYRAEQFATSFPFEAYRVSITA